MRTNLSAKEIVIVNYERYKLPQATGYLKFIFNLTM